MNPLIQTISGWLQHAAFTTLFLDAWLKSLAVLAVAGAFCLLLRRAAAATRHWVWLMAMASLPCLLLLACVPHAWQRPLWSLSTGFNSGNQFSLALNLSRAAEVGAIGTSASSPGTAAAALNDGGPRSRCPITTRLSTNWVVLAVMVWSIGAALGLVSVLAGQVQLRRLARNARRLQDPDWALLLSDSCDRLRLRRPVSLWQSAHNLMPLTWGWWHPVVLLPAEATHWPAERRRVVLLHELAHARRWDCLTQTVARIVCALYWINPLAWLAARRMCVERERACDDLVLNSGCKASDYATQLVDIARTFRRLPRFAGIAMARSPQLEGRIAAIVDATRARRLRPLTALVILVLMGALALSVGGSSPPASRSQADESALRQQQLARLEAFARAKEKQSQELAAKAGESISPQFQRFFGAATKGDWQTVTNRYVYYKQHHPQYLHETNAMDESLLTAYWQPVLEICLAYDQVVNCDPKYTAILADGIINSIPPGSIYFGGTDPGRGVPTAFCESSMDGDPFFTLTQNALANARYLEYLRAMYDGKIYTPTGEDSQRCFQEYMAGAMRRLQEHELRPGENVKMEDNRVQVSGQVAVMSINGLLAKVIFDRNPDRQFYIEESFPLDWMYPYLEPHGLIMKINRQPLVQLPENVIARDHEYWRKVVAGMLGDWLDEQTPVSKVVAFVDRVCLRKDLKGFTGDPQFVRNDCAMQSFSKLRSSIAGVYAWRAGASDQAATPPEYEPKAEADRQAMLKEADYAFRQSFALCPYNPEAVYRYAHLLQQFKRTDDAVLVLETFLKVKPQHVQPGEYAQAKEWQAKAKDLLKKLKSPKP